MHETRGKKKKRSLVRSIVLVLVLVLACFYAMALLFAHQGAAIPLASSASSSLSWSSPPEQASAASASLPGVAAASAALHQRLVDLEERTAAAWAELELARSAAMQGSMAASSAKVAADDGLKKASAQPVAPRPTEDPAIAVARASQKAIEDSLAARQTKDATPALLTNSPPTAAGAAALSDPTIARDVGANGVAPLGPWRGKGLCGPQGIVAVTYATHGGRDDRFCRAAESAVRYKIPWEVLGWGLKWEGLSQKLQASLDYARRLDPDCVMLFSDAFDVLFTQDLASIHAGFLAAKQPLLFAGECGCWPQVSQDKARGFAKGSGHICNHVYPAAPTPYRYLNSGLWAGYAKHAEALLEAVVRQVKASAAGMKTNDQELVSDMYMQGAFNISLDWHASVFQCMHETGAPPLAPCDPWKHVQADEGGDHQGTWRNTLTGTTPAVFHFNGGGKAHHLAMEAQAWYKRTRDSPLEEAKVLATKLRFNGKMVAFGDVCPDHITKTYTQKRSPRGSGKLQVQ